MIRAKDNANKVLLLHIISLEFDDVDSFQKRHLEPNQLNVYGIHSISELSENLNRKTSGFFINKRLFHITYFSEFQQKTIIIIIIIKQ